MNQGPATEVTHFELNQPPHDSIACFTAADLVKEIQIVVAETVDQDVQTEDTRQQQGVHL